MIFRPLKTHPTALMIAAALLLGGCWQDAPPETSPSEHPSLSNSQDAAPSDSAPDAAQAPEQEFAEPKLEVLDTGSEPRRALRYQLEAGIEETAVIEIRSARRMQRSGRPAEVGFQPGVQLTLALRTTEVSAEGKVRYEFEIQEAQVRAEQRAEAQSPAFEQHLQTAVGAKGWAVINAQGVTLEAELNPPPTDDSELQQTFAGLRESLQRMAAPMPEEPVGQGARWQVTELVQAEPFKLRQETTYHLEELAADRAVLTIEVAQEADRQQLRPPGLPSDVTATLESLTTTGLGTMRRDLRKLVPESEMQVETTTKTSFHQGDTQETLTVTIDIRTRVTPLH